MSRVQSRPLPAQSGFTMVELMVVIVILGLLGTMVGTGVLGNLFSSQNDIATVQVKRHYENVTMYVMRKNGEVPENLEVLTEPDPAQGNRPWIDSLEKDPWGNDYRLVLLDGNKFQVASNGPNGIEGDEDDIAYPKQEDN